MRAKHYTGFLCGCFSTKKNSVSSSPIDSSWEKLSKTKDEISVMEKYYYPEFVNFCYPPKDKNRKYGVERYILPVDREITIGMKQGREYLLSVVDIRLFILPYDLLIYAIQVQQNEAALDDITESMSILRNVSQYGDNLITSGWGGVLDPIIKVFNLLACNAETAQGKDEFSYFNLMENGNKLKLFQITDLEKTDLDEEKQRKLLFELGTLAPISSYDKSSFYSPSEEYFNNTIKQNEISVFNNWKGLSLFDTFSILSYSASQSLLDNWTNSYFEMIYIHSLFLKLYLFRMNILFRDRSVKIEKLETQFLEFEQKCCFHKISYNFLPLKIYHYLDVGLNINEEKKQLYVLIEQERKIHEKDSDRRMNGLLFFLTFLTVFSTAWDFSSLFNQLYPYEESLGSTVIGFRVVTTSLLLLILLITLVYRFLGKGKTRC